MLTLTIQGGNEADTQSALPITCGMAQAVRAPTLQT
jgi:hypothetical protein